MRMVVSRLVIGLVALTFAAPSYAAPKKKKGRNPAEANSAEMAPAPSDLTTLDSGGSDAGDAGDTKTPTAQGQTAEDPALYNLNTEIPLYKKQTSHESQRFSSDDPFLANNKHTFRVGFSITQFSYQEQGLPLLNEERGFLPLMHLRYDSAPFEKRFFFGMKTEVNFKGTSYTGSTINNAVVVGQNHSSFMVLGEMWLGARLADIGENSKLKAYLGLGYRYWSRMSAGDGIDTFDQVYQWVYLPIGLRWDYTSLNDWSLGVDLSVRQAFLGRVSYRFSGVDPTLADSEGILGSSALNFRLSVPVSFKKLLGFAFTVEPWFENYGFGAGSPAPIVSALNGAFTGFVQEPQSSTSQYGLLLTADFQF